MSVLWSRQNSGCSHKLAGHMPGMHLVHDQEMHIQGEGSAGPKWNPELGNSMAGEVKQMAKNTLVMYVDNIVCNLRYTY